MLAFLSFAMQCIVMLDVAPLGFMIMMGLVKSLLGLMSRSLFNTVRCMTDQDSSLGSSFIVSNITKSDEIP